MAELIAIESRKLSFRRDGLWYADDEPIRNARLALLFSRGIRADGDGGWMIDLGVDRQPVSVDDTPLVVTSVDGTPEQGFRVRTNDAEEAPLDAATLRLGAANVLYCEVDRGERGRLPARFLRPSYYRLMSHLEEGADGFVLRCGDHSVAFDAGAA